MRSSRQGFSKIVPSAFGAAIICAALQAQTANADTIYTSLSAWEAAAGHWNETTNVGVADYNTTSAMGLSGGAGIDFNQPMTAYSIGNGWGTWSNNYTGQVVYANTTSQTWSLSPNDGLGMFIEPDRFQTFQISVMLDNGQVISQAVNGNQGAAFFGWLGSDITSITISGNIDFAEGDFYLPTPVPVLPEPASIALAAAGLMALGVLRLRRHT